VTVAGSGEPDGLGRPGDDDPDHGRRIASELERAHPGFMIIWGSFSGQFVAYPLFGPPGTHFSATDPHELERLMGYAERHYRDTRRPP
jgi:hypothetical protein